MSMLAINHQNVYQPLKSKPIHLSQSSVATNNKEKRLH